MGITSLAGNVKLQSGPGNKGRYQVDDSIGDISNLLYQNNKLSLSGIADNTITDATVVTSAYDTSGNGGRKLVRLSNGWLVAGAYDSSTVRVYLFKSVDNGNTWTQLCYLDNNTTQKTGSTFAIKAKGTMVYIVRGQSDYGYGPLFYSFDATTVTNTAISLNQLDNSTGVTGGGVSSVCIEEDSGYLHIGYSVKNSSYSNCYNIKYIKGTINADSSVTWGVVEQVTAINTSGYDIKNPTIVIRGDNKPVINYEETQSGNLSIGTAYLNASNQWNAPASSRVYNGGSYPQTNPSAIFVPTSINGLANGRIWVVWHGKDATEANANNVRLSYSDDGGVTWSAMQKLTSGNSQSKWYASITVNSSNKVYVVYNLYETASVNEIHFDGTSWSTPSQFLSNGINQNIYPSTLFDLTLNFTSPLFIYNGTTKVVFYGTWDTQYDYTSGTLTKIITPADLKKWGDIKFDKILYNNTSITCDILDTNDNIIKSNISSSYDLSNINITTYPKIKVKLTLNRNAISDTSPTSTIPSITWEGGKFLLDEVNNKKYRYVVSNGQLLLEEV